ncbi:putative helicase (plasmid) [Haloarcula marismortui ATCC 43049]|uniref:Helicase n=2 Tax=Haloarcula marismortui TaxID=2238 RepID=Q5V7X1_HALMA|nr:putative helicase [Haloarcula marismortui ATCC 43049]
MQNPSGCEICNRPESTDGLWCSSEMTTIYSHPPENGSEGVVLDDHLNDVAARVEYVVPPGARTPAGEPLRPVVKTLGYVHDLGKATTFFQDYLLDDRQPDNELLRHHAPLGAFAAYFALDARGFDTETCLAGFVAVAKHHGSLPDITDYIHTRAHRREGVEPRERNSAERRQNAVAKQIKNIDDNARELVSTVFEAATAGAEEWASFRDGFGELLDDIADTVAATGTTTGINRDALSSSCYGLVIQCWGSLVLADKTSAAGARNVAETYTEDQPSLDRLNDHIADIEASVSADPDGSQSERLNHLRSMAREDVLDNAADLAKAGGGVATLTLPTGMGKTLTGLSAALDIRDNLGGKRVIYALPFTSVIDQVVDDVSGIYDTDDHPHLLTAHHHLADASIEDNADADEADRSDDVAGMLGESWRAGLTVTTFVQLFESLAGPGNRQSMKLPALRNSVVVLDEPQSLPLDWWKIVPRLVKMLTEQFGATVIAMTATQPKLFPESPELVEGPEQYFEEVSRVSYHLDASTDRYIEARNEGDPKSYQDAATNLSEQLTAGTSALAVCNTIDSARHLTERLVENAPDAVDVAEQYDDVLRKKELTTGEDVAKRVQSVGDRAILHLSTRLRPADRLTLVDAAKELTEAGHPVAVVSTQLIEAGVDISFDRVYRDLAPIDSVVQAAGRCNRSFERDRGHVTVWWLAAPPDVEKTPAEAVYNRGTSLLPVAADTLASVRSDDGELTERAVARDAVERYYDRLHDDKCVGKQAYADYVDNARADKLSDLSLIDQRPSVDVVICRTDADHEIVESVRNAANAYDFDAFSDAIDETKSLRISVPVYPGDDETKEALNSLVPLVKNERFNRATGVRVLDVRRFENHFDQRTGFIVPDSTVAHQFI